jgi:hypothetical protein
MNFNPISTTCRCTTTNSNGQIDLKSSATEFGNRKMCNLKFEDKKKFTYDISIFQQNKCKSSKNALENHQVVILKKMSKKNERENQNV